MKDEIAAAVVFLTTMVKKNQNLNKEQVDNFSDKLTAELVEKFKNHWYIDNPVKGQGYRCIRINEIHPVEPSLNRAAKECGLKYDDLKLPLELTVWVDPTEVTCRFGELNGTWCTVASFNEDNKESENGNKSSRHSSSKSSKKSHSKKQAKKYSQWYSSNQLNENDIIPGTGHYHYMGNAVNIPTVY
ncbi:protein BTG3-like [Saccoglossus kowalevskii]|uniref:Protein BTG3-like n=1 Tax=Saccoglossus kowalevskii TaxID=10224 RepID=A0ABM0GQ40_SACKO|nr:PREDICTED: protein BTG3-like [Saccoglossus kowalevskii]